MDNAFRGRTDQAFTYAAEVEMVASRQRLNDLLSCVQLVWGAALSNAGRYDAACPQLRRLFEQRAYCRRYAYQSARPRWPQTRYGKSILRAVLDSAAQRKCVREVRARQGHQPEPLCEAADVKGNGTHAERGSRRPGPPGRHDR